MITRTLFALALLCSTMMARAQDLYDTSVLRSFHLTFHDADWLTRLRANYSSETNILADLVVDGVSYPNVGVRIRGNTSYTALPAGSDKFSLQIEMDFVDANQDLMGYDQLNLNNGFHDPTFSREVVYNNYVAQFIPNPRANNVVLTLNGQNWGVYNNIQHIDKTMLRDYFTNADGLRIKCANNPNGPGLSYNGPNASGYTAYEVNYDGGLADPIGALIAVTNSLSNEALATWPNIDTVFAIDPSIWSVVLENFLTDDDSYVNKGCDFMVYRDPLDGRTHLMQRDANETFTQTSWAVTRNFTQTNKPVLNRVLAVAELRQRFMAHYRTALRDLSWTYFEPKFTAQRQLLDAAVQADPKKLYSYQLFLDNFGSTVTLPYSGPAGGTLVGVQQFVTQRASFLNTNPELVAPGPTINTAQASIQAPDPSQQVYITAAVAPNGAAISAVELYFRPTPANVYQRIAMQDDGASGDGAPGDGVYGALLPVSAVRGQRVAWYVGAVSSNTYASRAYLPERSEIAPNYIDYFQGSINGLRITEWMYSGLSGEFIELTNMTSAPIDVTGWSVDDDHGIPGAFSLTPFGVVQPGESVILTEAVAETFRSAWSLGAGVKIIGQFGIVGGNSLGRNDQINVYNASGALEDRLFYGDQTYSGTIRTQNRSGQAQCAAIGQNQLASWELSSVGDAYGSYAASTGDIGSPGTSIASSCGLDVLLTDGFE